jgi:hypothetical protein
VTWRVDPATRLTRQNPIATRWLLFCFFYYNDVVLI